MENLHEEDIDVIIVGSGWYGMFAAEVCQTQGKRFVILERNSEMFAGSSLKNQNRLHLGFHYPRNSTTRMFSKAGFDSFMSRYGNLTKAVNNNMYAVHEDSLLDAGTYEAIYGNENYTFEKMNDQEYSVNYSQVYRVNERYIDPLKAQKYFEEKFGKYVRLNSKVTLRNKKYFLFDQELTLPIVNCTYGELRDLEHEGYKSIFFVTNVYERIKNTTYDAMTVMDGEFYSIFPYLNNTVTVTGVKEGVFNYNPSEKELYIRRKMLELKIESDLSDFLDCFTYKNSFVSRKYLPKSKSDFRACSFITEPNVFEVLSGKIDTIFQFEERLIQWLKL